MKRILSCTCALFLLASCRHQPDASVRTVNNGYDREKSRVLVREIAVPTRANLDYAAWWASLILVDTAKVAVHPSVVTPDSILVGGLFAEIKTKIGQTPLSDSEIASPLAWKPVEDLWLGWSFDSAGPLVSKAQEFTQRRWGDTSGTGIAFQQIAGLYLHKASTGDQIWARIEFQRWMAPHLEGIMDRDGDGYPEVWARLSAPELKPAMVALLRGPYTSQILTRPEAVQWANELAALWYPVYNTDMVDLSTEHGFPQKATEADAVRELSGARIDHPFAVIRGRPFGIPLYLVFQAPFDTSSASGAKASTEVRNRKLDPSVPARLDTIRSRVAAEVASHGGSWQSWSVAAKPLRDKAAAIEASSKPEIQAMEGPSKTLLFRRELSYIQADDLAALAGAANPVVRIRALRDSLAALGIDFLFVPVPTKLDVEPGLLGGKPNETAQPFERKLLEDLAKADVETVDLLPALRGKGLWRKQDTHWKPTGAAAAAEILATRIRSFPWFPEASRDSLRLVRHDTTWTDFGDLRDRLAPDRKASWSTETVKGERFATGDLKPWDDAENASILLLGDSYLGVYQKIAPRAAGFSSYLASDLGVPVSVTMGWGGGPEAPRKLAAKGPDGLRGKRLVVWVMSVRDLFRFPGGWDAP